MLNSTRNRLLLLGLGLIGLGGGVFWVALRSSSSPPSLASRSASVGAEVERASTPAPASSPWPVVAAPTQPSPTAVTGSGEVRPRVPVGQAIPELFPGQVAREALQALAAQYDPKLIPQIATYLRHSELTVRLAAVDALVQVGDAAALPLLTASLTGLASDSEEAMHLQQAIEFLRLPPAGP
jgi:HEAT repeats